MTAGMVPAFTGAVTPIAKAWVTAAEKAGTVGVGAEAVGVTDMTAVTCTWAEAKWAVATCTWAEAKWAAATCTWAEAKWAAATCTRAEAGWAAARCTRAEA